MIVNVTQKTHWLSIVVTQKNAMYWSDGIDVTPFGNILQLVRDVFRNIYPNASWAVNKENYMLDILSYEK